MLDGGISISKSERLIGEWQYALLLIPLFFSYSSVTTGVDSDGSTFTRTFTYGGELALASVLLSGVAIILFLTGVNLEANLSSKGKSS